MPLFTPNAASIYRDFIVDGDATSGKKKPEKAQIRTYLAAVETLLFALQDNVATLLATVLVKSGNLAGLADNVAALANIGAQPINEPRRVITAAGSVTVGVADRFIVVKKTVGEATQI